MSDDNKEGIMEGEIMITPIDAAWLYNTLRAGMQCSTCEREAEISHEDNLSMSAWMELANDICESAVAVGYLVMDNKGNAVAPDGYTPDAGNGAIH